MTTQNGTHAHRPRRLPSSRERVLILGRTPLTECLLRELERDRSGRYTVVGVVEGARSASPGGPFGMGSIDRLEAVLRDTRPDRVVVACDVNDELVAFDPLLNALLRGIAVEEAQEAYERLTGRVLLETLRPSDVLCVRRLRRAARSAVAGRLLSIAVSLTGLIVLSPVLALIALAIALDSGRPVCFAQERLGVGGRRFKLLKFRTMIPASGQRSEWVRDNLDRLTRVGRWLRRFRLDELPQLVNILRGDMNLIGPRPHPVSNAALFHARIPYYPLRLLVPPGVTGWAQIRYGYANSLEEETEKMRYDLYYIKHRSLRLDLKILLGTLKVVALSRDTAPAPVLMAGPPPPPADLEAA
jgi:exopolysaccharide biosynthesis polyprenyl glycosylphosphotransferase